MNHFLATLTYKYARAFLNQAKDIITYDSVHKLAQAGDILEKNRDVLSYLSLAGRDPHKMEDSIVRFLKSLGLEVPSIQKLIGLLIAHKRLALIGKVFLALEELYKHDHNIGTCTITSAHPLTKDQKQILEKDILSLKKYTTIDFMYHIDQALIAGIRIRLDLLLWEQSVDQQLKMVRNALAGVDGGT